MIKVYPVNDCKDCPKLLDEKEFKGCNLSDVRVYDLDTDWMDYLEQFCPLHYLETIVEEAYDLGKTYSDYSKKCIKNVKRSVQSDKWATAHEFLNKVNEV